MFLAPALLSSACRLQVMYMPVTGPNGEQGFAPVPMPMPMPMQFQQQQGAPSATASPVGISFVQGPNGYYMPVPMGASAAAPASAGAGVSAAAPSMHSKNPFDAGSEAFYSSSAAPTNPDVPPHQAISSAPGSIGMPFNVMGSAKGGGSGSNGGSQQLPPLPRITSNGSISARASAPDLTLVAQRTGHVARPDSNNALSASAGEVLPHESLGGAFQPSSPFAVLFCAILCCVVLYSAVPCCAIQ